MKISFYQSLDRILNTLRPLRIHHLTRLAKNSLDFLFPHGISANADGFVIFGSLCDRSFLYSLKDKTFERQTIKYFKETIKEGMTVLDIGAYLGYYSLLAARLAGAGGKVYSFEPNPPAFRFLKKNIEINGYKNIQPFSVALSNQKKDLWLHFDPNRPSIASLGLRKGCDRKILVKSLMLDDFLGDEPIHGMKIDAEGFEPAILEGMEKTMMKNSHLFLFVEVNPRALAEAGFSTNQIYSLLRKFGYREFSFLDEEKDENGELAYNLFCNR